MNPLLRRTLLSSLILGGLLFAVTCCEQSKKTPPGPRDPRWAQPVSHKVLSNFHKITDQLYRGAQPSKEGMQALKAMGIKTILNLRRLHSDRDEMGNLDFKYYHIKFNPFDPDHDEVVSFLKIVTDPDNYPLFFHCQHGADRTGMMSAVYRVVIQGWSREDAVAEMTKGGYGYHSIFKDVVKYVKKMDVAVLRKEAGLPPISSPKVEPKVEPKQ